MSFMAGLAGEAGWLKPGRQHEAMRYNLSMRIAILGAGPAGLYFSYLIKRRDPDADVTVFEQNPADATFGFGVVFSDRALEFLRDDDEETYAAIVPHMESWRDITLVHGGERITIDGIGFAAIGRLKLLQLLQARAASVRATAIYGVAVKSLDELADFDLVVGADGVNSLVRKTFAESSAPASSYLSNRFAWFGTASASRRLTQTFVETECGAFNAHHYRYEPDKSTFIVETDAATFRARRLCDDERGRQPRFVRTHFRRGAGRRAADLQQFDLAAVSRSCTTNIGRTANMCCSAMRCTPRIFPSAPARGWRSKTPSRWIKRWRRTTTCATRCRPMKRRGGRSCKSWSRGADSSAEWYERFAEHMKLPAADFAMSYITRSGRVDIERLRKLSPDFVAWYESAKR